MREAASRIWRRWREMRAARREIRALRERAGKALAAMGTANADLWALDLAIMRVGVHLLEANAAMGPVFLMSAAQVLARPADCGEMVRPGTVVH